MTHAERIDPLDADITSALASARARVRALRLRSHQLAEEARDLNADANSEEVIIKLAERRWTTAHSTSTLPDAPDSASCEQQSTGARPTTVEVRDASDPTEL